MSGFGKLVAIDLLVIETEHFTLAVEGNIDFSRYGRFMDEEPSMTLRVRGIDSTANIQVFDAEAGELVAYQVGHSYCPIFFENGQYTVVIQPKMKEHVSFYHEYKPFREAITYRARMNVLSGTLHFQNEVGLSSFEIRRKDGQTLLEVTLEVFPTKLDYKKDYQALLREVNEEIYNLAYHFIQRTYLRGSAKIFKDPSLTEFYRLVEEHFHKYEQAITQVERMPHHQLTKEYIEVHGSKLRRQDSVSRSYLRKNASRFVDVAHGMELAGRTVMPTKGLLVKKRHTVDTHENRYVKWTMERVCARLQHLQQVLQRSGYKYGVDTYGDVLALIARMEDTLRKRLHHPFWREVGKLDRSIGSLVLQMAPGYREVYQIHTILSQSIVLQGELYKMSVKDIATLYEYWTFLKLGQIVGRTCEALHQDVVQVRQDGLFVNLDTSKSAVRTYQHPVTGEEIILTYQYRTHKRLPTVQQVPDTMLSIGKKSKEYHYQYVFDAKYRVDFETGIVPGPKQEDINTMHRYRDSIVAESGRVYERTAFGAYVLFPLGDVEGYKDHSLYKSIGKVNIGGLPFLPNATELVEEMVYNLLNRSADELQRNGILPIGTKEYFQYREDEQVLVVRVCAEDVDGVLKKRAVQVLAKDLPTDWNHVKKVALFVSGNGVTELGELVNMRQVEDCVCFYVDAWWTQSEVVIDDRYDLGCCLAIPKTVLESARSLTELLLVSDVSRRVWHTLRQVGKSVKVIANEQMLSMNSVVQTFLVDDIEIFVDWDKHQFSVQEQTVVFSNIMQDPYTFYLKIKHFLEKQKN